jgi:hypothetical protein
MTNLARFDIDSGAEDSRLLGQDALLREQIPANIINQYAVPSSGSVQSMKSW